MELRVGDGPVPLERFVAASEGPVVVRLGEAARARIAAARAVVDRFAAGEAPVYGLNTGLGGNLGHRIRPDEMAAFQAQMLAGRSVGAGPWLPEPVCRAALLARVIGVAGGASGLSPAVLELMLAMLARGLAPAIPSVGSIGAGDLVLGAAMGGALIGAGEIWAGGRAIPAGAALAAEGLSPARLGPKDALALANHSAVSVALAARLAERARRLLWLARGTAALAGEGFAMNPTIFDARLHALRPATGQEAEAAWFRAAFHGSPLARPGAARKIQDALSFRTIAPVFAAAATARERLAAEVAIELNAAADNPAILGAGPDAEMLSTPNFHTPAIALALDTLALAWVQMAAGAAQRIVKLMAPDLSGLPKYLSPVGGASAGLMPMQKTVAALLARIRHEAEPACLDSMAVSEMVEDVAPQTPLAAETLGRQLDAVATLLAIEAIVGAQAVDLRGGEGLGAGARPVYDALRARVPPLGEDRAGTPDIAAAEAALAAPGLAGALAALG